MEVRGVDEQLRTNVLAYLSFERYRKGGAELNADTSSGCTTASSARCRRRCGPFGYYEPKVDSTVTEQGHGDWRVVIDITPGEPVLVAARSTCASTDPARTIRCSRASCTRLPLHAGDRLNHALYEGIKSDLQRTAATYGYLDAKLIRNELVVDPPNHTANIALELETGERYRFGATSIEQHVIRDSLVRRYLRYHQGDSYDLTQVLRTQFALDDSQYFANLEVLPQDPDRQARIVPVKIHADAEPPPPLLVRRRLRHRHRRARHARLRGPAPQHARAQLQRGGAGGAGDAILRAEPLPHPGRRPGAREHLTERQPSSSRPSPTSPPSRSPSDRASPRSAAPWQYVTAG